MKHYIIYCYIKWFYVGHWCRTIQPEHERFSLTDGTRLISFRMRHCASSRKSKSKSKSKSKFTVKAQAKSKSLRQLLTCGCFWGSTMPEPPSWRHQLLPPFLWYMSYRRCDVIKRNQLKKICIWVMNEALLFSLLPWQFGCQKPSIFLYYLNQWFKCLEDSSTHVLDNIFFGLNIFLSNENTSD